MQPEALKLWRKSERERLVAARMTLDPDTLERYRRSIDAHLERAFPSLSRACIAFCWPIRNEYDARHLVRQLRERGAVTALPVVVTRGAPLVFREWHPGIQLAEGALGIPYPASTRAIDPEVVLLPMNGWDEHGYRLGYGGGFFDRTLASLTKKPLVLGISYEVARIETVYPQSWDMPVDYVVTERGIYQRIRGELVFLGAAHEATAPARPSASI